MADDDILLIEDDAILAMGLQTYLNFEGYQVHTAANGKEGLSICKNQKPGLVISDVVMGIMDGLSFLRELRSLPGGKEVPVIMISGHTNQKVVDESKHLGVVDFISKPFEMSHLIKSVRMWVQPQTSNSPIAEKSR
ncbi:MAG: response regulator [candidate division Zixibacteria bacterium]|nr:response regulator [candidate division Zixibacteria bacterium]NIW48905.1 response regulator [Gammaproteobacteria bacterium]NIR65836.1 response regulator [candidate division Zixibacteria bacterium]NIS47495.1 response regulator [candidate division Zixibacteria bacterium]NIT52819.1 response regulator [candidate division Zixibacteria bacterium]